MALAPGTRLGPYAIVAPLGAGGMGEVYRARDTRLDRSVAVKVLPSHLTSDPARRARLEREAKAISSLNHPHICTLYDVGHEQGTDYLVMELVEGETLAERLKKGALPLEQTLRTATEIADALDKAHREGVIHRDLKPGNVMLTKTGSKLMDFGLAKRALGAEAGENLSALPTEAPPLTGEGTLVGTMAYMAPEQLEGKEADARSDLWAFGCVLYEMATGRRAFEGKSQASLIGAIMGKEPPEIAQLQPLTPPALERLVKVCLAKDPDGRLQNAHDVVQELRWLRDAASQPLSASGKVLRPRRVWPGIVLGALGGALIAATVLELRTASRPPPGSVLRFAIDVPASRQVGALAFSPDGAQLVYVGTEGGQRALFLHSRDRFGETRIPGTEGATWSFFSPDGSWIAFFAGGRLNRVRADGTDLSTICRVGGNAIAGREDYNSTGTWAEDGTIILSSDTAALSRLSAPGAEPVPVTRLESDKGELAHAWPHVLPDHKTILFSILTGMTFDAVPAAAVSLETGVRRMILKNASAPRYLSTGHLLYADSGILAAIPFDRERLQVVGAPVPIVEDLSYARARGAADEPQFALSGAGDLAYVVRSPEVPSALVRVDRSGRTMPIADLPPGFRATMSLSPDGRRLALYRMDNRKMSVWTLDVERGVLSQFVAAGKPHAAVWSPDGQRLAFSSDRSGAANLFVQAADGTGTAERLVTSPHHADPGSWSSDGRFLAYAEADPVTGWDVWALDIARGQATPVRRTAAAEQHPALSPGGRWVAYASDESGRFEVYVEAFPAGGKRLQLSVDGGREPLWAPDGRQLFYRAGDQLMSVRVTNDTALSAARPAKVLDAPYPYSTTFGNAGYAVAPDGQHFYFWRPAPQPATPTQINVVVNWLEELKARVAAGQAR